MSKGGGATAMTKCLARQYSDQMMCAECGLAWDTNDPDPPTCRTAAERARDAVKAMGLGDPVVLGVKAGGFMRTRPALKPDWSKRGQVPTDWVNELGTLGQHPGSMPAWVRSAINTIYKGLTSKEID